MKHNTQECLERMTRILGEEAIQKYQYASASYDVYSKNPLDKIFVDNPVKMDLLHYILAVTDCIAKLFNELEFENSGIANEYEDIQDAQFADDVKFFQKVYNEDIRGN